MKEFKKQVVFDVKDELTVKFISENLSIKIIGTDTNKAIFDIMVQVKNSEDENLFKIDYNPKKNLLEIDTTDFEKKHQIQKSNLQLSVPFKTNFIGKPENGKIDIKKIEGNIEISAENGEVILEKIKGDATLISENGMSKIISLLGNIKINSENGMIKLEKTKGNINLKTENSMIKISDSSGKLFSKSENGMIKIINAAFEEVNIKNENGSIYYEANPIEKGKLNLENENGRIKLILSDELQYDLTAKNIDGSIHLGVEGSYEKLKDDKYQIMHIVKGNGNVKISLVNESGSIRISKLFKTNPTEKIEQIISSLTNDQEIKDKIEKAKKLIKEIKETVLEKKIEEIEEKTKEFIDENKDEYIEKGNELAEKIKTKIDEILNKTFEWSVKHEKSDEEQVKKRSRMKILQMLQDGKITSEQAEKLLNALENNDAK